MNFFPDFAPNSRKEWRLLLFQSNLRKQIRKLPKILKFVRIIHYYSKLFTGVLSCECTSKCAKCTTAEAGSEAAPRFDGPVGPVGWQNFGKMLLVFGCIGSDFCKKICALQHFSKSTRFSSWNFWNLTKFCNFCDICSFYSLKCIGCFSNRFFAKILRLQRCKRMQIL